MKITTIPTDDTQRSTLQYGTPEFPFACYHDQINHYSNRHIEWHWHREFELSYIRAGTVRCFVDDACVTLSPGEALFINSGMLHHFESEDGVMDNLVFAPEFLAEPSSAVFQESVVPYLSSDCSYYRFSKAQDGHRALLTLIRETGSLSSAAAGDRALKLYAGIVAFWSGFVDLTKRTLTPKRMSSDLLRQARLRKMMQYMQANYPQQLTLSDIARQADVSASEALRCFRCGLKTTPLGYLTDYRLRIAVSQLCATRSAVYQIAASVGFESSSYFCRKFKERYGVSPARWRKAGGMQNQK